jgi:hypothetical protein
VRLALSAIVKWLRRIGLSAAIGAGVFALVLLIFFGSCMMHRPDSAMPFASASASPESKIDAAHRRPLEDAYFTFPEWYIVWSYQERAKYLEQGSAPSEFPYFASIHQYWRGYCFVTRLTHARHQFNFGDHLMLVVIGTSFAVEYAIRGTYEHTVGALSEWISGHHLVEEDAYAARVAREYADFVEVRPWYEFHFAHAMGGLWRETPFWGEHVLRKWERKGIFSVDYGLQAIYATVIEKMSHLTYGEESVETYVVVENVSDAYFENFSSVRRIAQVGERSYIVSLPRYQEFTEKAAKLAMSGARFEDIAGNQEITVTGVGLASNTIPRAAHVLYREAILTRTGFERIAVECHVQELSSVLNELSRNGFAVEHVYDY